MTSEQATKSTAGFFEKIVSKLSMVMAYGAVSALLAMACVTFADVILRYFFNSPISGAVEIIVCLMGLLVFLGLALVTLENGHIRVDVMPNLLSARLRSIADVLAHCLSFIITGLIAWRVTLVAIDKVESREVTQVFELPIWGVAIVAAFGTVVFLAAFWVRLNAAFNTAFSGSAPETTDKT